MEYKYELYHWGLKGMKWGVRRYQNEDGTLTELGKKRYNRDADEQGYDRTSSTGARYKVTGSKKNPKNERLNADANRWVKEDREREKQILDDGANLTRNLQNLNREVGKSIKLERVDLSHMTDKEMREQINRELLERQYNEVFTPQKAKRGQEHVDRILGTTGAILGIGSSALAIALSIQKLTGKA